MKRLIYVLAVFALVASSCGGGSPKKESTKEVKEDKPLSLSTKEGMMQLLDQCNIKLHDELEFLEVKKESNNYIISFIANGVDETKNEEMNKWFLGEVEKLENKGWKKHVNVDNEKMLGSIVNHLILLKPSGVKVRTSYGFTFESSFNIEEQTYKFTVSAD
jgi:hypothetical protein